MNVQDLLGAMVQGAAGGQGRQRLENALGGGQGDVLGQILGAVLGGGGAAAGAGGGLGDLLGQILGGAGAAGGMPGGGAGAGSTAGTGAGQGGLSDIMASALGERAGASGMPRRAPLPGDDGPGAGGGYGGGPAASGPAAGGGLGDLLGQLLGGAGGGAGAGGLLSVLASLAIGAMQGGGASAAAAGAGDAAIRPAMPGAGSADPETVSLLSLKAMIAATKADGGVDDQEIQAVMARMGAAAQDPDARAFLEAEFRKPLDLREIVAEVRDPQTAAQVYLASLLAIRVDTRNEAAYLQELSQALRLPSEVVERVHRMVGLPSA